MRTLPLISLVVPLVACDRVEVRQAAPSIVASAQVPTPDSVRTTDTLRRVDSVAPAASSSTAVTNTAFDSSGLLRLSTVQDSICGEVAENGFNIPDIDRRAVAARFGRPDSVRANPIPNIHRPAQIDTVVDVFYPGIQLHYFAINATPAYDILQEAHVSDNKYLKFPSLGIGATASEITRALGPPHEQTEDTYKYSCALHVMSGADVTFHFAGGRVTRVDYFWESD